MGIVMRSGRKLQPREIARYSRQIILPEIGLAGQERLAAARVLVIGAGGLGSPVSLYLAAAGIGAIGIAEHDRVEEHNLQRQILHDTAAAGRPKAISARDRLRALNPHVHIELHSQGITTENAIAIFSQYDIIVDGSDNFGTRYLNNDAAFFARKPLVYGSILRFEGQVSLFHPSAGGPCYRCIFPKPPPPGAVPNCQEAGVIGALCGIVGGSQAMEAIKFVLGVGESLAGRLLVVDTLAMGWRALKIKEDPACPICGTTPSIRHIEPERYAYSCALPDQDGHSKQKTATIDNREAPLEIDVAETRRLLKERSEETLLLDVREPYEREICRLPGDCFVPMHEVAGRLQELPRDKHILVYCHLGRRSLRITQFLRDRGFARVSNVTGGINAWAELFDPLMPRY